MVTVSKAFEVVQAGKKAFKQSKEVHSKVMEVHAIIKDVPSVPKNRSELLQAAKKSYKQGREIHGKAQDIHGQVMDVRGQFMDVHGNIMEDHGQSKQQAPQNSAGFKKGAKGVARGCLCGFWFILKAEAKKYITYVLSLLFFAVVAIGLVCFLIPVLWHHAHLQLLTLTTNSKLSDTVKEGHSNAADESVNYRIYLLHYCISGLTTKAEKHFNLENGCHPSKQALYDHILPALSSTFTPPLPGKGVPGASTEIQALFRHYGYTSFCLYTLDIILLPIVAGVFIWWFISTATPWKRTFRAFLCFFTATLLAPALLQTVLIYRTIHILKHHIELSTSSLNIALQPNFLYIILVHLFWIAVLLNIIIFRLMDCCRNRRKMGKARQAQLMVETKIIQEFDEQVYANPDGVEYTSFDTKSGKMQEMQKSSPRKDSMGITRKPVYEEYTGGGLGGRKLRENRVYVKQSHGEVFGEKEEFEYV